MILEREFYKSISTTRALTKSLRAYFLTSIRILIKGKSTYSGEIKERGLPELVSLSNCTGCKDCESICPTKSLDIEISDGRPLSFILDVKSCIFCGLCEEVCSPKVLSLTDHRDLASHGESFWKIDLMNDDKKSEV